MKSGADPHSSLHVRGSRLFDRIEYRPIETPEDKDSIYLMRYRAYLHGGIILPSESMRVRDDYDDAPNAWTFGIYVDGELCSSLRLHVLTPERRMSFGTELFGDILHPRIDRGEVFIDPARFVADPEKAQRFPELPYLTLRLAYLACEYFSADTALATRSCRPPVVLSPGLSLRDHRRTAFASERIEEGGTDGIRLRAPAGLRHRPFPHHEFDCCRTAEAVCAQRRACSGADQRSAVRTRFHYSAGLTRRAHDPEEENPADLIRRVGTGFREKTSLQSGPGSRPKSPFCDQGVADRLRVGPKTGRPGRILPCIHPRATFTTH